MNTGRRIDQLEGGLSATDAVLLWVGVVQGYPSLAAYAGALHDGRPGMTTPARHRPPRARGSAGHVPRSGR